MHHFHLALADIVKLLQRYNICFFMMERNIQIYVITFLFQILALAKEAGCSVEVEQSYLDKRFVAITAYFY